jgi:hypothetical protein
MSVLLQGPFCISRRKWEHRKSNKDVYVGISVDLGKLKYPCSEVPLAETRLQLAICQLVLFYLCHNIWNSYPTHFLHSHDLLTSFHVLTLPKCFALQDVCVSHLLAFFHCLHLPPFLHSPDCEYPLLICHLSVS